MAFIKKEAKHIPLKIESFRTLSMDGDSIKSQMVKSASDVNLNSARIGRLDLYEEAEDVLEHYKKLDFDIVDEMKKRDGNLLWVRARAIDADVPNENGDYFSWEEITKEREVQSDRNKKKMPAYKTFEGVPIYTNHENTDIQKAKGKVVFSELDEEEKCVYCTFYVDVDAYPDIAKMIQLGTITDVSMGCFPPGTPVMTSEGYKPIEEIHPSELLVDGDGYLTKIRNKQELHYKGPLTEIYIEGGAVIRCTPNHPLFKVKEQNICLCGCGEKLEEPKNKKKHLEKRFKQGHHQNIYNSMKIYASEDVDEINKIREQKGKTEIEAIEAGDLKIGDYLVSPIGGSIINSEIDVDLARLIGYFLAEGCLVYNNNKLIEVQFCFSIEEKDTLAAETIEIIEKNFGHSPGVRIRKDNNCIVWSSNKKIKQFLLDNCNRYSYGKKLKNNILFADPEIQKHIIGAWLSGDGYLRILPDEQEPSTICGWTVSQELMEQMSFILNRLGIYHTIHAVIEGKYTTIDTAKKYPKDFKGENNKRIAYCINIPSTYARNIIDYCSFKKDNYKFSQRNGHRDIKNYLMKKISDIKTIDYDGMVYNFEVENKDHSYIVDGIKASNCQVEFSYCSICGNKAEKESEWCLVGDTLISMGDGPEKEIDKIEIGDKVLTHLGNIKKVIKVMERDIDENILKVETKNIKSPLLITKNHPIYASINGKDFDFIDAELLKENYYILNNNKNDKISQIEEISYKGKVYNLEIEDDNSYVANGVSVHNCNHLKERKGKRFSGVIDKGKRKGQKANNELVYEDNHDLKFIELSIVSQGAFENCTVDAILDHNAVLKNADKLRVTASSLKEIIDQNINDITKKRLTASSLEILDYLDDSKNVLEKIDKFSSSVIHNSMQKTSNMNKHAFMNVLDTLNDVLNKIEAVIISLLSRKDNIDLAHVAKISKAMADLQAVISDLIDDGVGTLADAVNLQQGGQQQPNQQAQQPQEYTQPGNVGRSMGMEQANMQTQPVANIMGDQMSNVPFQFVPTLEPAGFEQQNQFASIDNKWIKISNNLQNTNVKLGSLISNFNIETIEKEEENLGGSYKMSQLNERVANALMNKISTVVEQPIIASRDNGKFKVVISDKENEEILGYYDGKPTNWQPSSLDSNDIDLIRENRIASVTQKLMEEFVDFVKTAAWNPVTPSDVQEIQVGDKRSGNPKDVQEIQVGDKRSGNPKDVQEIQVGDKRSGNPRDVQEIQLQENSSADVLGRSGNPEDVQEIQVGEVRKDVDNRVTEHKLQSRRSKCSENKIASASLNVLACAVCDSGASPSEIIEAAEEIVEDEKYIEKIASYASKYNQRLSNRERVEFGLDESVEKDINVSLYERMADALVEDEELAPSDIKAAFSSVISAPRESMKKAIGRLAKEQNINIRLSSSDKKREDLIKGAIYASISDVNNETLDRSHLKVALFAVAETAEETKATPEEIFDVIENIKDDKEALVVLETERLPNSTASRIRDKNRKEFWGKEASTSETKDIERVLFASLADYAETMQSSQDKELPSYLIWQVTKKLAGGGENSRILVEAAIEAKKSLNDSNLVKNSASLTDRTDTVREIRLSMDEIPEVDPSSEEFAETVRDYTIAFLQNKGYQVDPETFNFTRLTVNDKAREIVAIVQSSIVKEFDDEPFTMEESSQETGLGFTPSNFEEGLITPMAMQQRKNRRDALVKEAQAAPAAGGAPAAPPMGGEMGTAPMAGEETGGPGLSSLMGGDDESGGMLGDDEDLDNISSPGNIKPIGTICPGCGSTNVDLAAGKGECSDCHTKFEVKISLDNIVTPEETEGLPESGEDEEIGEEGLGAALSPPGPEAGGMPEAAPGAAAGPGMGGVPAAPAAGPGMGGGMPLAASVRWYGDAEQFVKLAREKSKGLTDAQVDGPKPPGTVCVACGNKQVRRAKSQYFCDKCGTIGKIDVEASKKHNDKLIYTVSYLLPPMEKLSYKGDKNLKSRFIQFNDKEREEYNKYKDGEISLEELKKVSPRVYSKAKSMQEKKDLKDLKSPKTKGLKDLNNNEEE